MTTPDSVPLGTAFVGIDVHKYSHTAVALDCFNQELGHLTFSNKNVPKFLSWLKQLNKKDIALGLEDMNGNGKLLSRTLLQEHLTIYAIASVKTERERKKTTHKDKSDYLDAKGVAKVTMQEHWTLPQQILTQKIDASNELKSLVTDRDSLVRQQTRIKNNLHVLLHHLFGDEYAHGKKNIFNKNMLEEYKEDCMKLNNYEARSAIRKIQQLLLVMSQITEIDKDIQHIDHEDINKLTPIAGCGRLTASKILGEIKDIQRFKHSGSLAKYAGLAPRESSSSSSKRRYTDKGGNRILNRAIHTIALSQIGNRGSVEGKEYYQKKLREGKSKLHALRCLKRQVTKRIFSFLSV